METEELKESILKNYPNWETFMKDQEPRRLIVNYDNVTRIDDVYHSSNITLELLSEIYPMKDTLAGLNYMTKWIIFLNEFLNINKGIQAQYIGQLAYILYSKHNDLRLSDLKLITDFILESRYGTFYGSIDTQRIVSSFYEYKRERNETFAKIEAKKQAEEKRQTRQEDYVLPDFSKYQNLKKFMVGETPDIESLGVSLTERMKK